MLRLQGEERWPGAVLLALVLAPLEEGLLPAPPPSLFLPSFPCPPSSPLLSPLSYSFHYSGAYCGGRPIPGLNLYYLLVLAATRRVGLKASWMGRYTANWKLL